MKTIVIVLALIIVAGGAYLALGPSTEPGSTDESASAKGGAGMKVPAPGNEGVDEMVVNGDTSTDEGTSTTEEVAGGTAVFDVSGKNFEFDVKEIRVKKGDTVTINLTSTDGFHDWVIPEFDAATDRVQTGQTASVTFVASEAGEFEYYCSVSNHRDRGMVGTLIVEE